MLALKSVHRLLSKAAAEMFSQVPGTVPSGAISQLERLLAPDVQRPAPTNDHISMRPPVSLSFSTTNDWFSRQETSSISVYHQVSMRFQTLRLMVSSSQWRISVFVILCFRFFYPSRFLLFYLFKENKTVHKWKEYSGKLILLNQLIEPNIANELYANQTG